MCQLDFPFFSFPSLISPGTLLSCQICLGTTLCPGMLSMRVFCLSTNLASASMLYLRDCCFIAGSPESSFCTCKGTAIAEH